MDGYAVVRLADAARLDRAVVGSKARVLGGLSAEGYAVPDGFVVIRGEHDDAALDEKLAGEARRLGGARFAVRSSAEGEDLPDASYAGLYESMLGVPPDQLGAAVREVFATARSSRLAAYRQQWSGDQAGMAVLVQVMVDASAAGVAFTAHPVTGDRDQTVVTAVPGLGEALVSGQATGEEWTITGGSAVLTRPGSVSALNPRQATAVAELARRTADRYGAPQDVEWAVDRSGRVWLLQARPITALPAPPSWDPPGPGLWMRNFRLGEWLPEPLTPLFATWLLPLIEDGYLDGMQATLGVRIPFRWTLINGWYYNAAPAPSPVLLGRVLGQGGRRAVRALFNVLIRVGRNPAAADRVILSELDRQWRERQLPRYRQLVSAAAAEADDADPGHSIDQLGRQAGVALWYLAVVGGSAWKMEACLIRFARKHLADVLPDADGGAQVLLRGLPGAEPRFASHAVHSADWYHPVAAELSAPGAPSTVGERHAALAAARRAAEQRCVAALADRPRRLTRFRRLLAVTQRYTVIREQQAHTFTLAWPVLRDCARRLGRRLAGRGTIIDADDVFFCTHAELDTATRQTAALTGVVADRRTRWQQQRRLAAPLTAGRPPRLIGDVIDRTVQRARSVSSTVEPGDEVLVGHPASAGRATGRVCVITDPHDFATFTDGAILVAKATAPAWTPLFARAAAVVTDGGTLAAHASLIAREYGIPAVVGTGTATTRLLPGRLVTVDGTAGTVTVHG